MSSMTKMQKHNTSYVTNDKSLRTQSTQQNYQPLQKSFPTKQPATSEVRFRKVYHLHVSAVTTSASSFLYKPQFSFFFSFILDKQGY